MLNFKRPLFYSLPPAGQKISLREIWAPSNFKNQIQDLDLLAPLRNYLGSNFLLFLNSGRSSLWILVKALSHIKPEKKEVIIPAYTCPAIVSAIIRANLIPILVDNNLKDYGLEIRELEKKINKETLAVIIVHLLGYPANIIEVKEICKNKNIFLIEDSAQGFGNTLPNSDGKKLGLIGDAGFFSFGRGKPISILHGGVLITQSEEIFKIAQKIYNGLNCQNEYSGLNYRFLLSLYFLFASPYLYWIPQRMPALHLGETIFEPEFEISKGSTIAVNLINEILIRFEKEKEIRKENSRWYSENLIEDSSGNSSNHP
ncbi:MAG: DegT/DnrJ/EryC1/StrS family aminotransferase, partial [Candidatus Omnitrophica bacterium]|nr:DegT/DnrJ/EryC1/StrS family aminotransferase [Candidatus Omnitrophota bacterium]